MDPEGLRGNSRTRGADIHGVSEIPPDRICPPNRGRPGSDRDEPTEWPQESHKSELSSDL